MSERYKLNCKNNFLSLSLGVVLGNVIKSMRFLPERKVNILAIYSNDIVSDIDQWKEERINSYDVILCRDFYCDIIKRFIPRLTARVISLDSTVEVLQHALHRALLSVNKLQKMCDAREKTYIHFSDGENTFISDYLYFATPERIASVGNCTLKSVYNRKRNLMERLSCGSNQTLWLTLVFILNFINRPEIERTLPGMAKTLSVPLLNYISYQRDSSRGQVYVSL
ncbi:hypothetical protein [Mangrovibacter plantisponsor]|uniref:Uncharacterized protein n=1 Tax=Mangrovibacter plantisponsor TaxID=451513 RepID=A0A317PWH0_9ENTR|nr:hypothetical protein [Mangrovibacter plantisponsor]PWW07077.1 hypothetical protein DES37_109197 [Mangrovibacter plantisponsor]